jgi:hypothetical protein
MSQRDEIREMMGLGTGEEQMPDVEVNDTSFEEGEQREQEGQREGDDDGERGDAAAGQGREEGAEGQVASEAEEDTLEKRYARLLDEHNRLSAQLLETQGRGEAVSQPAPQPTQVVPQIPAPVMQTKFTVNKDRLMKALIEDDAEAMTEELTSLVTHMESQRGVVAEEMLLRLPQIARNIARQEVAMTLAIDAFYKDNSDLMPHMATVGRITNEIAAKKPGITFGELLQETEKETRRILGLRKQIAADDQAGNRGKPAFHVPRGARRLGAPKIEGIRADIAEMQKAMNR